MFYFPKFCRICIQIENCKDSLVDVETLDYDKVKLSEKLKVCSNMEINKESLSTLMCDPCIKKLRTAYEFRDMCQKSTTLLQDYLSELLSTSQGLTADKFINSELCVSLVRIPNLENKQKHEGAPKFKIKREEKYLTFFKDDCFNFDKNGPMKDLINFSKTFDFGYKPESTKCPIEELTKFSERFFETDFTEYNNTILQIRNSKDTWELEELFEDEESEDKIHFEEVVIEPCIKMEMDFFEEDSEHSFIDTSHLVEACYHPEGAIKQEKFESHSKDISENKCDQFSRTGIGTLPQFVHCTRGRRCRTQGNPFINPQLLRKFELRSFSCPTCNRSFKSPGYLNNHMTRLRH